MPWLTANAVRGFVRRAVPVDEEACRTLVERLRARQGTGDPLDLARAVVEHHARRAALRGLWAGLPPRGLAPGLSLAIADARHATATRASMASALSVISDPSFFGRVDWKDEVLRTLAPGGSVARAEDVERSAPELLRRGGRVLSRGILSSAVRQFAQGYVVRWLSRPDAPGRFARVLPITAGLIGAAWHYAEVRREGRELVEHYFGYWTEPGASSAT